jgi:hypothetical protein
METQPFLNCTMFSPNSKFSNFCRIPQTASFCTEEMVATFHHPYMVLCPNLRSFWNGKYLLVTLIKISKKMKEKSSAGLSCIELVVHACFWACDINQPQYEEGSLGFLALTLLCTELFSPVQQHVPQLTSRYSTLLSWICCLESVYHFTRQIFCSAMDMHYVQEVRKGHFATWRKEKFLFFIIRCLLRQSAKKSYHNICSNFDNKPCKMHTHKGRPKIHEQEPDRHETNRCFSQFLWTCRKTAYNELPNGSHPCIICIQLVKNYQLYMTWRFMAVHKTHHWTLS